MGFAHANNEQQESSLMNAKQRQERRQQEQEDIQGQDDIQTAQRRQRMENITWEEYYLMIHDNHNLDDLL